MDDATRENRRVWESASTKYVREYDETLAIAASGSSLLDVERTLLHDVLQTTPRVVHLQSGNGTDDIALIHAGARSVIGVDYSEVAVGVAQRRAIELGVPCRYVVAALPEAPLPAPSPTWSTPARERWSGCLTWSDGPTTWPGS